MKKLTSALLAFLQMILIHAFNYSTAFVETLLDYKAPIRSRNLLGWSSMDEAISYRDEETGMVNIFFIFAGFGWFSV